MKQSILIMRAEKVSKDSFYDMEKLYYDKVYVLVPEGFSKYHSSKKIIFVPSSPKNLPRAIKTICEEEKKKKNIVCPYFMGEKNSKYSILVYNIVNGTNIDYKIFRHKDVMNDFLGKLTHKRNISVSYKSILTLTYQKAKKDLGSKFIIKPQNTSSSMLTFKVTSEKEFKDVKKKLLKKYEYVVEEYIDGQLNSLDFFFDGEHMFLLCNVREIPFVELIENHKFSPDFYEKYGEDISRYFSFFLPLRYNIPFTKLSPLEYAFFNEIKEKLKNLQFKGFIHLEYKLDKQSGKIGFIEWGARSGRKRISFIKQIYHSEIKNIPGQILCKKNYGKFKEVSKGIYIFNEQEFDVNLVGIKTNFLAKTHMMSVLKHSGDGITNSFDQFIVQYFKEQFGISINKNIDFVVRHSKDFYFYPFYERNDTRFDYVIQLNDENFAKFRKKKYKIIEKLIFHTY